MDPSPLPSRQSTGGRVQEEGAASSVVPSGARDLDSLGKALRDATLWCGLAMAAFALAWPAMWVAPIRTLNGVLGLSLEYATAPGDATTSFFRGALTDDPGAAFYPVVLLFRATPLTLVGAALAALMAAVGLVRRRRPPEAAGDHALTWGLLAYAALHLALITLSAKKFDRYMLPALLALDVVAAVGWCGALGAIRAAIGRRLPRALPAAGASSLAVVQAALLLAPLSLSRAIAYYNPWTGGLAGAAQTLPVGWGEGIEEAARYLAAQPDAERLRVATWAVAGIAPHFPGPVDKPTAASLPNADYVVVYVGDVQGETPLAAAFAGRKPDFTARVGGQPYAWVYRNAFGDALGRAIEDLASTHGAPQDAAIVLNAPSAFERQYAGAMRWGVVTGDAAEVARGLAGVISGAKDVVYVAYDGQPAHTLIRRLLARNGLLLEERPFAAAGCGATLYYYRLLPEASALRTASASIPTDATFGGELALEGYGLSSDAIEYRQELGIALRWRARTQPEHDYHASVRLVDAEGHTWGQYDAPLEDAAGSRATAWAADTEHTVDLPVSVEAGAPPGTYRALLSLYRLDDLELLAVSAGDGPPTRQLDLGPVRVRPATEPPRVDELTIPHRADLALGGGIRVLGYALSRDVVPSGEEVTVTLYWQSLEAPDADYDLLLRVAAPGAGSSADGREVGRAQARPVGDEHPTDRWRPGEVLRSAHAVRIDPDAPSGAYQVTARLVPRHGEPPSGADVALAPLAVEHVERIWEAPPIAAPLEARFGDGPDAPIALLGYDLAETEAAPGDTLHLTLYWRAVVPMDRSYTAFVHLLDGAGVVRGQRDTIPMAGERPTDGWLAGEIIVDAYAFTVAEDAPTGPHQIEIGLYDPTTGERLAVVGPTGVPIPERRLLLDRTVSVQR